MNNNITSNLNANINEEISIEDMPPLSKAFKLNLRTQAHDLKPVVMIGQDGVTTAVLKEIDLSLKAHKLIKVRILGDSIEVRQAAVDAVKPVLQAHLIQTIGKLIVLYRASDECVMKENNESPSYMSYRSGGINHVNPNTTNSAPPREVKVRKISKANRRPPMRKVLVLGNQRVTQGGLIKRKKPRLVSKKKNFS
jgi:RNA-binding protein